MNMINFYLLKGQSELFDVLVSLLFYIGTSYLMNVHFGSKDFHLSCFGGIAYEKKQQHTTTKQQNTLFCMFSVSFIDISCVKKKTLTFFNLLGLLSIIHSSARHVGLTGVYPTLSEPQTLSFWQSYRRIKLITFAFVQTD